ncbi:metallophosphoesterase family protein [Streptomyces sp. NPDC055955]|uniref:metallophosphoesterase family protein n=1 Tax=Streptomyces sp. NPDC055955 TaxID=3345665 RepID=UPI0035D66A3F
MDRRSFMATTGRATLAGGALAATGSLVSAPVADAAPAAEPAAQRQGDGGIVRFNIISDIQGDLTDFGKALDDLHSVNPGSAGLGIAGDITPRGYDFEYAAVRQTLDKHPHPKNVAWAIGNHEFYVPKYSDPNTLAQATWPNGTTEDSLFRSFYTFAQRGKVYSETSFGGVPVLSLGTERYSHYHDAKLWDEVWISDEQFAWLEDRLAYWARRRRPVMVLTHHPLPNTVSGTHNKLYMSDYLQPDRLLSILGRHKDVFLFSGHTHWDLNLSDWVVRRVVPGTGNLEGFTVVNTAAVQVGWMDDGKGGEVSLGGAFNQGLQVEVGLRSVVIKARDFTTGTWLKQLTVPLHTSG